MQSYTLIKNGLFFSGDHKDSAIIQDVLINTYGIIESISKGIIIPPKNCNVIDAKGKWIVPGFIDSHTHYDAEILASPGLKESARHGITTVILGNCSVTAIYNNAEDTADSFTRVEAVPREIVYPLLKSKKNWSTSKGWKSHISNLPLGINVASYVGHSDLRMKVMGIERSLKENETATKAEQRQMFKLLDDALNEGFLGLSTMDNPWDKMDGNRYWSRKTPSFYSSWKERKPLLRLLRNRGAILQGVPNVVTRLNAVNYMLSSIGLWRKSLKTTMLAMMDLVGDRYIYYMVALGTWLTNLFGRGDFRMQSLPCAFTVYYDGVDSVMFEEFPSGQALRHLAKNLDQQKELIKDAAFRGRFKKDLKQKFAPKLWHKDLSKAIIIDCDDQSLIGKNFYQLSKEKNQHPVDAFLDTILKYNKRIKWTTTIANDRHTSLKRIYRYPYNIISFSDAGAHLTNMAFYNFPLKMIKHVQESIDKEKPIMSMEKCIWRLTKEQADWFEIDCGYLAEGKRADLVILDPYYFNSISEAVNEAFIKEFDDYKRLVNRNNNVVNLVMVGGRVIFKENDFVDGYGTDNTYGKFLEKQNLD